MPEMKVRILKPEDSEVVDPIEFSVLTDDNEWLEVRKPEELPEFPGDSKFNQIELQAFFIVGKLQHPFWFSDWYLMRIWLRRREYFKIIHKAWKTGRLSKHVSLKQGSI